MHLGAGTVFFLVLAFGLFRFFPRLAAGLTMLAFVGALACVGLLGYGYYVHEHPEVCDRVHAFLTHTPCLDTSIATGQPAGRDLSKELFGDTPASPTAQRQLDDDKIAHVIADLYPTATPAEAAAAVARLRARVAQ